MAIYRINTSNAVFRGAVGDLVIAEPGPFMDAAVRSGVITRQMDEVKPSTQIVEVSKPSRGKRIRHDGEDTQSGN